MATALDSGLRRNDSKGYWAATLSLLTKILVVWFLVSYGAGILFAPALNAIHLGGYPLGFWFAQQGPIYVFLILIVYYTIQRTAGHHSRKETGSMLKGLVVEAMNKHDQDFDD